MLLESFVREHGIGWVYPGPVDVLFAELQRGIGSLPPDVMLQVNDCLRAALAIP